MNAAADKIQMMHASIRCLVFGLLGLLPVVGLPFAFAALWFAGQARAKEKRFWNPAQTYRVWGTVCAAAGTLFWVSILALFICISATNTHDSGHYYYGGDD